MVTEDLGTWSSAEVQRRPFDFLHKLQAEQPVYWDAVSNVYIVTRQEEVVEVTSNPALYSNQTSMIMGTRPSPVSDEIARRFREHGFREMHTLGTADPPAHTGYRGVVDKIFTPSYIREREPYIREIADSLIDGFVADGRVELVNRFSINLPMYVICDELGVDRKDMDRFKDWSTATMERQDPTISPDRELELADAIIDMQNYLHDNIERYRRAPAKNLLSLLVHSTINGKSPSVEELLSMGHQFLVAGNETTTSGITAAMYLLLSTPGLVDQIRADAKLIPQLVEEALRIHSPAAATWRQTTAPVTLGGVDIPEGAVIMVNLLAANHDPAEWPSPEEVQLGRKGGRNHVAFGRGLHFCIGNQLARSEMRIAIERLIARLPNLRIDPDAPAPRLAAMFATHGFENLYLAFDA